MTGALTLLADGNGMNQTVSSGPLLLAVPVAVAAGLVSFFSPCVLPLVPGYLSYITGFSAADLADAQGRRRGRMLAGSMLFIAGFAAVFISFGALFGNFGNTLRDDRQTVNIVLGSLTVLMGLAFMGFLPGFTNREFRSHRRPVVGLLGAPLLGVVFGLGWAPCTGPTMASLLSLSFTQASAARGAFLMAVYCLGLGLPFVVAALAFRKALGAFSFIKRHYQWVMRIGGGMLVAVGVLLITGGWDYLVNQLQYVAPSGEIGI